MHAESIPLLASEIPAGSELLAMEGNFLCYRAKRDKLYRHETEGLKYYRYFHIEITYQVPYNKDHRPWDTYSIRSRKNNKYHFTTCIGGSRFFELLIALQGEGHEIDRVTLDGKEIPVNKKVTLNN